jgi:transcriptional regulator with XRE-family HTH domain
MGRLERGASSPTLDTVLKMLPILQVSFPEFASEFEAALRRAARKKAR